MTDVLESANNPANKKEKRALPAGFVPLSGGVQKLTVPEKDGYHRRWFRGDPGRIARAKQAGYEHVLKKDVDLNNVDLGGSSTKSGGTDLGSLVSVISGDEAGPDGQYGRLYLMECPIEWHEASRALIDQKNEDIVDALTHGIVGNSDEADKRYSSVSKDESALPDLFRKNKSKRRF